MLADLHEWLHPVRFALAYIKMFTYVFYLYFPVVLVMLGDDHN